MTQTRVRTQLPPAYMTVYQYINYASSVIKLVASCLLGCRIVPADTHFAIGSVGLPTNAAIIDGAAQG